MIINPDNDQKANYKLIEKAFTTLVDNLTPGTKISEAYRKTYAALSEEKDEGFLKEHLSSSFGHGIGYKSTDSALTISAENDRVIEEGMVFFAQIYLEGVEKADSDLKYSFVVADTVIAKGTPENVTDKVSREFKNLSYTIDEGDEEEEEEEGKEEDRDVARENKNVILEERTRG